MLGSGTLRLLGEIWARRETGNLFIPGRAEPVSIHQGDPMSEEGLWAIWKGLSAQGAHFERRAIQANASPRPMGGLLWEASRQHQVTLSLGELQSSWRIVFPEALQRLPCPPEVIRPLLESREDSLATHLERAPDPERLRQVLLQLLAMGFLDVEGEDEQHHVHTPKAHTVPQTEPLRRPRPPLQPPRPASSQRPRAASAGNPLEPPRTRPRRSRSSAAASGESYAGPKTRFEIQEALRRCRREREQFEGLDSWTILGLPRTSTQEQLSGAYRRLRDYYKTLARCPYSAELRTVARELLERLKRAHQETRYAQESSAPSAPSAQPRVEDLFERGRQAAKERDWRTARRYLRAASQRSLESPECMGWLGWVEFHLGQEEEGLDSLRLAWSLKQEDLELALLLARLEFAKGEAELAIKRARWILKRDPSSGEVKTLLKRWESETLS